MSDAFSAMDALSLGPDVQIVIESDAYEHVALPMGDAPLALPSASRTMRSLAEALAHGDASRFDRGVPNTSWSTR